mmetsp:Transcript_6341/g.18262  ORF Transcript_6341/g.18262 Transcript_6341/m.18262 type:complete len:194 (+) Transcript_6341:918-1499(+)
MCMYLCLCVHMSLQGKKGEQKSDGQAREDEKLETDRQTDRQTDGRTDSGADSNEKRPFPSVPMMGIRYTYCVSVCECGWLWSCAGRLFRRNGVEDRADHSEEESHQGEDRAVAHGTDAVLAFVVRAGHLVGIGALGGHRAPHDQAEEDEDETNNPANEARHLPFGVFGGQTAENSANHEADQAERTEDDHDEA